MEINRSKQSAVTEVAFHSSYVKDFKSFCAALLKEELIPLCHTAPLLPENYSHCYTDGHVPLYFESMTHTKL